MNERKKSSVEYEKKKNSYFIKEVIEIASYLIQLGEKY